MQMIVSKNIKSLPWESSKNLKGNTSCAEGLIPELKGKVGNNEEEKGFTEEFMLKGGVVRAAWAADLLQRSLSDPGWQV